ncbi:hypothetical protein Q4503_12725 [Colwellia sp. 6_MG-2023]|uniref:hypothetical protein n=1 Tax=Colwellia sp. 6_MG-2023 TaxID=3062676 RepID=UPI0026E323E4|nr:hypothetical protein [Colwellia sp. 6_MG-2023]MDO6488571.1 hypothetical protein [Colwellia sp. 6_MG-2023]
MVKAVSRVLFLAVMLVAFIGQVLAFNTSMSCETYAESHSLIKNHTLENNDPSIIDTDNSEDCCNIECCDMDCVCMAHVCSSSTYFSTDVGLNKTAVVGEKLYTYNVEQSKSIITLLYRPPIFIS